MGEKVLYERSLQGGIVLTGEDPSFFANPPTPYYADRLRFLSVGDGFSLSVGKSVTAPEKGVENRYSRRHFIHYICRGALFFNGRRLAAGQGFYCPAARLHTIRSDKDDPAIMLWLSAGGAEADRLFGEHAPPEVFSFDGEEELHLLEGVLYCPRREYDAYHYFLGLLRMILALRTPPAPQPSDTKETHVQNALSRLEEHPEASVEDLARALYLNRKYLSRIFRQVRGETLQSYLQTQKMQRAKALLARGERVGDVALSVGYRDSHAFSHAFRRFFGYPPGQEAKKGR